MRNKLEPVGSVLLRRLNSRLSEKRSRIERLKAAIQAVWIESDAAIVDRALGHPSASQNVVPSHRVRESFEVVQIGTESRSVSLERCDEMQLFLLPTCSRSSDTVKQLIRASSMPFPSR
jgi:hypothetical protein